MTFRPGDRVLQRVFGAGDVVDVNDDHITISFDTGDVRKFVVGLVQLEPTTIPSPRRSKPVGRPRKRRPVTRTGRTSRT